MKNFTIAIAFLLSLAGGVFAQTKSMLSENNHSKNPQQTTSSVSAPTRARITQTAPATQQWGNATATVTDQAQLQSPVSNVSNSPSSTTNVTAALTETYQVGPGDILDIQISASLSTKSTLYTVGKNGMLDYPLASGPISVTGLTTDAIAARLKTSIRVFDTPSVIVKVRDYASHSVNVIGFVSSPGMKILRREAVPLYVVLAEATPLNEASSVTVVRKGQTVAVVGMNDSNAAGQLVVSGDVIKVSDRSVNSK